jgi:short-subunit dehydrogenase
MKKVLAIFGAGPGLSSNVARHYGEQGHAVALVGRNAKRLDELAARFKDQNIDTHLFPADLSIEESAVAITQAIETKLGRIDVLYYGPVPAHEFTPAQYLTAAMVRPYMDIFFYGLVTTIHTALPGMKKRGEGTILAGFGGTAQGGLPGLSGPGTAMNAARNYLQSLHGEMLEHGINVGAMTTSGSIRGSADIERYDVPGGRDHLPENFTIPIADPAELLELLLAAAADRNRLEARWPAVPPMTYLS